MTFPEFFDQINAQDILAPSDTRGHIQWKGTDVCMDIYCECGNYGHFDGEFFYHYECPACHKKYAVGSAVRFIPMTEEQIQFVEEGGACAFRTTKPDE